MCNRHVAHVIAEYEAARLGEDTEGEEGEEGEEANGTAQTDESDSEGGTERTGVLSTVVARFTR